MIDHIDHGIAEIERIIPDMGEAFLIVHAVDDGVDYPGKLLSVFADPHVICLAGLIRSIDYLFHDLIPQLVLSVENKLGKTVQVLHSWIFSCHDLCILALQMVPLMNQQRSPASNSHAGHRARLFAGHLSISQHFSMVSPLLRRLKSRKSICFST